MDEELGQHADTVHAGPLSELLPGIGTGASGARLQHEHFQLITQRWMCNAKLFGRPGCCAVKTEPGFNTDHQEIQCVRQCDLDLLLTPLDHPAEPEVRQNEASTKTKCPGKEWADAHRTCSKKQQTYCYRREDLC